MYAVAKHLASLVRGQWEEDAMEGLTRVFRKACRWGYFHKKRLCAAVAVCLVTGMTIAALANVSLVGHVQSISLKNLDTGEPVQTGADISLNTNLQLRYSLWDIRVDAAAKKIYFYNSDTTWETTAIAVADTYELSLPTYLKIKGGFTPITIKAGSITIGTIAYDDGGKKLQLTFASGIVDTLADTGSERIADIWFAFACAPDGDAIGQRNSITIPLAGAESITLSITENTPEDARLNEKTGTFDAATGLFSWTVTVLPEIPRWDAAGNTAIYTSGYVFKDTLGAQHTYVTGSFGVQEAGGTLLSPTPTVNAGTLSYTFPHGIDQAVTVTYKTMPADGLFYQEKTSLSGGKTYEMVDPKDVEVKNDACLYRPNDSVTPINKKSATVDYSGKSWLTKTAKEINLRNKTMTWELVVETNGRSFSEIRVYDRMDDDLTFIANSLLVDGVSKAAESGFNGKDANLLYRFMPASANSYTITYRTSFSGVDLNNNTNVSMDNTAWLEFQWAPDGGPGDGSYPVPQITKPTALNSSIVAKRGAYDPATKLLKWTVIVNANRLDITGMTLTDELDLSNQTGVIEDAAIAPLPTARCLASMDATTPAYTVTMTKNGNGGLYTVVLNKNGSGADNALGYGQVEIVYYTMATNPAFYANNATATFKNKVTADHVQIAGETEPLRHLSAEATIKDAVSRVLDKEATG